MTTLLMMTPMSGLLPTIHGDRIIQMPMAQMAQLRPYIRAGITVNPSPSTAIAIPMIRLCCTSVGWLAVKWSTQGEMAQ